MHLLKRLILASLLLTPAALPAAQPATPAPDWLEQGFLNPPESARPHTWWQWMNGNITREGLTADLEAMKQIGLGGATIVNLDCGIPRGKVPFMTPPWQADFGFAMQEAQRLDLKLSVENCAGWSSSGGPWNTVTNAMQRLTSSETNVQGPAVFDDVLPQPPVTLGFYRDIAVLAFKAPAVRTDADTEAPAGTLEIKRAVYGEDGGRSADVTARLDALLKSGQSSIVAGNDQMGGDPAPGAVKQLLVEFTLNGRPGTVTVGEGGTLLFPINAAKQALAPRALQRTSLDQTFVSAPPADTANEAAIPSKGIVVLSGKLTDEGRLRWQVPRGHWIILRLGYTPIGMINHPAPTAGTGLECDKLSKAALDAHWDGFMRKVLDDIGPLAGRTLTSSFIDSYEVGNQDWTEHFRAEFKQRRGYDPLKFLPTFAGHIVDSEAVTQRFLWDMRRTVADLFAENYYGHFAELCHEHGLASDLEPYTGPFESLQCGAPADTVMGEFWAGSQGDPSIKLAASVAHIYGKTIAGAESFTGWNGRWEEDPYSLKPLGDLMFCQGINRYYFHRYAMQPWTNRWPGMTMGQFGINFDRTQTWWKPGKAWIDYISRCEFLLQQGRPVADAAYFDGQSAPVEMRAGSPVLPRGYDYDAVNADVLEHGARVQNGRLTLKSGANYALLILPPKDANLTPPMLQCIRKLVQDGATVVGAPPQQSPSLADYPKCDGQVKKLAGRLWGKCDGTNIQENNYGQGRIIWGESLARVLAGQNQKPDFEFLGASAASDLAYTHRVASAADIYFVSNQRRQADTADCTFRVSGQTPELWHPETGVIERAPVWHEQDGRTVVHLNFDPAESVFVVFRSPASGNQIVSANVQPAWQMGSDAKGGLWVQATSNGRAEFRTTTGRILQAMAANVPAPQAVAGEWTLNFPPNWGAPASVTLDKLISWTDHTNRGVKYFSGTASYEKDIHISADRLQAGRELWLDLGTVKNFAEVYLNGQNLGILWKPPFRANLTAAAHPGINKLVVKVTNLWPNRLIGDEQLPPDVEWDGKQLKQWPQWLLDGKPSPTGRLTFTTWHHWTKDSPLLESGLLGPVTLRTAQTIVVAQPGQK
jgi:hypothetical protein